MPSNVPAVYGVWVAKAMASKMWVEACVGGAAGLGD
jgi:hypothetical protein